MNGFLFDENLPQKVLFVPSQKIIHSRELGKSMKDTSIWEYACQHSLCIVTKDTDFSDRAMISSPPPWVVYLRFGNLRKRDFHLFLERVWPQIEKLLPEHKLINVYLDKIETIRD